MLVSGLVYSSTLKMEVTCSTEASVDNGLHGIISQKMELFLSSSVLLGVLSIFGSFYRFSKVINIILSVPQTDMYFACCPVERCASNHSVW
jgi:hypothetical protein